MVSKSYVNFEPAETFDGNKYLIDSYIERFDIHINLVWARILFLFLLGYEKVTIWIFWHINTFNNRFSLLKEISFTNSQNNTNCDYDFEILEP